MSVEMFALSFVKKAIKSSLMLSYFQSVIRRYNLVFENLCITRMNTSGVWLISFNRCLIFCD